MTDLKISKPQPQEQKLKAVFSKDWQPRIALLEAISVSSGVIFSRQKNVGSEPKWATANKRKQKQQKLQWIWHTKTMRRGTRNNPQVYPLFSQKRLLTNRQHPLHGWLMSNAESYLQFLLSGRITNQRREYGIKKVSF